MRYRLQPLRSAPGTSEKCSRRQIVLGWPHEHTVESGRTRISRSGSSSSSRLRISVLAFDAVKEIPTFGISLHQAAIHLLRHFEVGVCFAACKQDQEFARSLVVVDK